MWPMPLWTLALAGWMVVAPPGAQEAVPPPGAQEAVPPPGAQEAVLPPGAQAAIPPGGAQDPAPPGGAREDLAPAAGRFLVARRGMPDPRFANTVVLLVDYGPLGALGLIVNRPTEIDLPRAFPDLAELRDAAGVLWYGGPVRPGQAAMLAQIDELPGNSLQVLEGLRFSTDPQALRAVATTAPPARFRVYAGYSGWAPQQLDAELARGDWRVVPASVADVFGDEGQGLWERLIGQRGTWVRRGGAQSFSRDTLTPSSAPSAATLTRTAMGRQHTVQSSTYSASPPEQSTTMVWLCQHQGQVKTASSSIGTYRGAIRSIQGSPVTASVRGHARAAD